MSATQGWIVEGIAALVTWIPIDIYLISHKKGSLTLQMSEWMHNPRVGPFVFGAMAALVVGFTLHFIMAHR